MKSAKSLTFRVAEGVSSAMQHAAPPHVVRPVEAFPGAEPPR
jgi:hypothetical protein